MPLRVLRLRFIMCVSSFEVKSRSSLRKRIVMSSRLVDLLFDIFLISFNTSACVEGTNSTNGLSPLNSRSISSRLFGIFLAKFGPMSAKNCSLGVP